MDVEEDAAKLDNWSGDNSSELPTTSKRVSKKRNMSSRSEASTPSACSSRESIFTCPICYEIITEAYMTRCGHSYCHDCIKKWVEMRPSCPTCQSDLADTEDGSFQIFPNITLNNLITSTSFNEKRFKSKDDIESKMLMLLSNPDPTTTEQRVSLSDIDVMLRLLKTKRDEMESNSKAAQMTLLKEFLVHAKTSKEMLMNKIKSDIALLEQDLTFLDAVEKDGCEWKLPFEASPQIKVEEITTPSPSTATTSVLSARRKRMYAHFDCLEECYFSARTLADTHPQPQPPQDPPTSSMTVAHPPRKAPRGLERFTESLSKFTRYSQLRSLSTLNYASDLLNGTSIVSSIEFDKDNEYFAIAGVTKKIKVFENNTVIRDTVDIHYPVNEMLCVSKISCISWSSYHKSMLACSNYEGTVTLWDAFTGQKLKTFNEHEKRCWSVDFNKVDTKLLASGSDDTKVKLWAINQEHSVTSIEAKANVCCVRFNPDSMYHLAMGSADHCVHYYDLRNCKTSLGVFKGHKKAVSYVKFLNSKELVSASTDSQLKLWKTDDPHCLRSFTGHVNEKNFVGLATDGDYIACGSENNSLYVYYKGLSTQIQTWSFRHASGNGRDDGTVPSVGDTNEFVSAVCWKSGSPVVVAANSQGTIKLLELV